jgi:hypothetical protein
LLISVEEAVNETISKRFNHPVQKRSLFNNGSTVFVRQQNGSFTQKLTVIPSGFARK